MEVPSTTAGVLAEIRVPAGAVAPVGAVVGVIADGGGAAASATATETRPPPQSADRGIRHDAPAAAANADERPRAALDPFFEVRTPARNYGPARLPGGATVTPLARRLAGEAGIDLAQLRGSGPRGRIVARDIAAAPQAAGAAPAASGPSAAEIMALFEPGSYQEVPLDGMRRTIAARLTQAAQTIPHFYLTTDADIGRLIALREEANSAAPKDHDGNAAFRLSVSDFIIRALALGLYQVPTANVVWAGDRILRFVHSDIGVAVALEGGLITPVIRHAEEKSLSAISAEMKDLVTRGRAKKLKPAEYQGGAAAISNLGMHGVREFSAIINPPHATILAVGAARRQAIETADGGVAFASMLSLTLSCDHRVVDGALGAELLATIKRLIESPVTMLV
jgi:pyruvate dehydrogenase E2 component (dihydrolipoamide acetyltransferase)